MPLPALKKKELMHEICLATCTDPEFFFFFSITVVNV